MLTGDNNFVEMISVILRDNLSFRDVALLSKDDLTRF